MLFDILPADPSRVRDIVQGLMVHIFWAGRYGLALGEDRTPEVQIRSVARKVDRLLALDPRPLSEARPTDRRLVGNCRDFSLLLTALLRHHGVPARARCGFGRYFLPNHYEDHWVAEYWNLAEQRWVLLDAQLDALQREALGLPFDPLDVPRDQFIVAGQAWQLCRQGLADPDTFGIHDLHGLWFVRANLGRDAAALNNVELLPWDVWGVMEGDDTALTPDDWAALDQMALLTAGVVPQWTTVRDLYQRDSRWTVPPVITSYSPQGPQKVDLAAELGLTQTA